MTEIKNYSDFKIYADWEERVDSLKNDVITDANAIVASYQDEYEDPSFDINDYVFGQFAMTEEEVMSVINTAEITDYDDAVDLINLVACGNATSETDTINAYEEELEKEYDITAEIDQVLRIIDLIKEDGFKYIKSETSTKSISTYLTFSMDDFEMMEENYDGIMDFDNLIKDADEETFTIRISDHEPGEHYVERLNVTFKYPSNYVLCDVADF